MNYHLAMKASQYELQVKDFDQNLMSFIENFTTTQPRKK